VTDREDVWRDDKLGREGEASFLTRVLIGAGGSYALNIDGEWGTGKTFMLQRWREQVSRSHPAALFNAWESDFTPDPLVGFTAEIANQLKSASRDSARSKLNELGDMAGQMALRAAPLLARIATRAVLKLNPEELHAALGQKVGDDVVKQLGDWSSDAVKGHLAQKETIACFRQKLMETVDDLEGGELKPPLFIFIDELDRCRPSYAVSLLEIVKHVFSVPKVVFVVATDTQQLEAAVKSCYGDAFDAERYLRRFFDRRYVLPEPRGQDFVEHLYRLHPLPERRPALHEIANESAVMTEAFGFFGLSLRDQEQCYARYRAALLGDLATHRVHSGFLLTLIVFQHVAPDLFRQFVSDRVSPAQLWSGAVGRCGEHPEPVVSVQGCYYPEAWSRDAYVEQEKKLAGKLRQQGQPDHWTQEQLSAIQAAVREWTGFVRHRSAAELTSRLSGL